MRRNTYIFIISLLAVACSKEAPREQGNNILVGIDNNIQPFQSKASGNFSYTLEPNDKQDDNLCLELIETPLRQSASTKGTSITADNFSGISPQFTVEAIIEGQGSKKYLNGAISTYNPESEEWTLTQNGKPCYWPEGDDKGKALSFWAYTSELFEGAQDNKSFEVTSVTEDSFAFNYAFEGTGDEFSHPYTKDFVVAYKKQHPGAERVNFQFSHALANVSAYVADDQDPLIKILTCDFENIYTQGSCVCSLTQEEDAKTGAGVSFAWMGSKKGTYKASLDSKDANALNKDNVHFVIPQTLGADAKITVSVNNRGTVKTHSFSLNGVSWKAGYKYTFKIKDTHELSVTLSQGMMFLADSQTMYNHYKTEISGLVFHNVIFKTNTWKTDYPNAIYEKYRSRIVDPFDVIIDAESNSLIIATPHKYMYGNASMREQLRGYGTNSGYSGGAQVFEYVKVMDLRDLNTSKTTNMRGLFDTCHDMTDFLYSDKFDTSNVTDMYHMFCECRKLETLDLRGFDTRNVTNMTEMFDACYSLSTLILGENFVIPANKTDMMHLCGKDVEQPVIYCSNETWEALTENESSITKIGNNWIHRLLSEAPGN